ncbi:unnamed protein product [Ectocarpus fasciculatus]
MCAENVCSTFVWRGPGFPELDSDGTCSCVCDNDTWSERNILGQPSCVPVVVHLVFGGVGLALSVAVLCHAAYHLHRQQIQYHAQRTSASTSPIERCRRQLHVTTIAQATLNICYFSLVLGDALRWSVVVLMAAGIPNTIGGVILTSRMWMYSNDPRLMSECPEVVALSTWLERPRGYIMACCTLCIGPIVATGVALANYSESAVRMVALGGVLVGVLIPAVFWVCGRSLIRAINNSLQLQAASESVWKAEGHERSAGYQALLNAKRKVMRVMVVTASLIFPALAVVWLAIFTPYGLEAPLLMFCIPIGLVPPIWLSMNVQLHAKRSRLRPGPNGNLLSAWTSGHLSRAAFSRTPGSLARHQQQRVVPTQEQEPLSLP